MIVFTDTYVRSVVDTVAHGGWSGPMAKRGSSSARRGLRAVGDLLGRGISPWAPAWAAVVGAATARGSVCLGPNDDQVLRVMTRTPSDRDELLEREADIVETWNQWARQNGGPAAVSLACWVYEGITPEAPAQTAPSPPTIEARWIEAAEADIPPTENEDVRGALVAARARLLRRRARDQQLPTHVIPQDAPDD